MKITVKAPANIAFIKYWGKKNEKLRIPMNNSISMNLSDVFTVTSVELKTRLRSDKVKINKVTVRGEKEDRVIKHLDRIRKIVRTNAKVTVDSKNNFPQGAGIASSASGFAALTLAATRVFGLDLSEKELSILARLGSGSACRSIPDGFVEWKAGNNNGNSYAHSLYSPDHWGIKDIVVVVEKKEKEVGSTRGHNLVNSSPFLKMRITGMNNKLADIKRALRKRDFAHFGEIVEQEAINMHSVMMTSNPPLFYWSPATLTLIRSVRKWREDGIESYFTIDAGPNIHIICKKEESNRIVSKVKKLGVGKQIIVNTPTVGARVLS